MAESPAQRQRARDKRQRKLGRVQRKIWLHPEDVAGVLAEVDRRNAAREPRKRLTR